MMLSAVIVENVFNTTALAQSFASMRGHHAGRPPFFTFDAHQSIYRRCCYTFNCVAQVSFVRLVPKLFVNPQQLPPLSPRSATRAPLTQLSRAVNIDLCAWVAERLQHPGNWWKRKIPRILASRTLRTRWLVLPCRRGTTCRPRKGQASMCW